MSALIIKERVPLEPMKCWWDRFLACGTCIIYVWLILQVSHLNVFRFDLCFNFLQSSAFICIHLKMEDKINFLSTFATLYDKNKHPVPIKSCSDARCYFFDVFFKFNLLFNHLNHLRTISHLQWWPGQEANPARVIKAGQYIRTINNKFR